MKWLLGGLAAAAVLAAVGLIAACIHLWRLAASFPEAPMRQPSRLFARAVDLRPGEPASLAEREWLTNLSAPGSTLTGPANGTALAVLITEAGGGGMTATGTRIGRCRSVSFSSI
ncbi:MAG TPA: hypothetical protein VHR45_23665 [Thermoanaerobaculia bacterium]|nr:hypothetical protein [Thermoanaerobaculia bacterium]